MPTGIAVDLSCVPQKLDKAPGEWVYQRSNRRERRIWLGAALFLVIVGVFLALAIGHRVSIAASFAFLAAVFAAKPYADRYADRHLRLLGGAVAERQIGEMLNGLRQEGWVVIHDIEQPSEGNIDHIASGSTGVYVIETKSRRYLDSHLRRTMRQAMRLHDELGVFVTPVVCLYAREGKPFKTRGVWVVPGRELIQWLRNQHNQTVNAERLDQWMARL
jgi:hypothetical protein